MKYTYDTEFLEDGRTIMLISIGIVAEDGREYYAVNHDMDFIRVRRDDWLWANVVPSLPTTKTDWDRPEAGRKDTLLDDTSAAVKPKWVIANETRDFLLFGQSEPELWAYYGAYDHVSLAWLFGPMKDMPKGIPYYTHEIQQILDQPGHQTPERLAPPALPAQDGEHNALEDARWNMAVLRACGIVTEPVTRVHSVSGSLR